MLISSRRHTPRDLALWRLLEAADKRRRVSPARLARSEASIREFCRQPCYCSVSWGKDSVVTAHLVATFAPHVPLAWIKVEPICNPDCEAVRDAFLAMFPSVEYHEVVVQCRVDESGVHASGTLERGAAELESRYGRRITGVRADESFTRLMRMSRWHEATVNTLAPIGWWTFQDVMTYLAIYDLPVHPAYAMLGGGRWPRERLRVASLDGVRGSGGGRAEWEREYYGDIINRIAAR